MDIRKAFQSSEIRGNKGLVIGIVLAAALAVGDVLASGQLVISYQDAQETEKKISSMKSSLQEWKEKEETVSRAPFRPVTSDMVDTVQSKIILSVQGHELQLVACRAMTVDKKNMSHMRAFELSTKGPYEKTVQFLQEFRADNALITMDSLEMKPDGANIEATVRYTVYVK